jgi:hypothetical protein
LVTGSATPMHAAMSSSVLQIAACTPLVTGGLLRPKQDRVSESDVASGIEIAVFAVATRRALAKATVLVRPCLF